MKKYRLPFVLLASVSALPVLSSSPGEGSSLPTLNASPSGVYRLDDLLAEAEVEGVEVPTHDESELTLLRIDCAEPDSGFVRQRQRQGFGAPAGLQQQDGFLRITGGAMAFTAAMFSPIEVSELGMVVFRIRVSGVDNLNVALQGADDAAAGGGDNQEQMRQQYAQATQQGQIRVPDDGEWHTISRRPSDFGVDTEGEVFRLILTLGIGRRDAHVDLEYIHFFDSRAPYVHEVAGQAVLERGSISRAGMFLNSPGTVAYPITVPEGGRFSTHLTGLGDRPFYFTADVTAEGTRTNIAELTIEEPGEIVDVSVDLSPWAGKNVILSMEIVEEDEPTVAFLLRPMVYGSARSSDYKNVLLYFCDTLRANALSCYGNERETTPHLDAVAAEGVRFERCFTQGSWTYISMPSSLTSLQPTASGVRSFGERLSDSATTISEVFRQAGYVTAAFSTNPLVGRTTHVDQGFDLFFGPQAVADQPNSWVKAHSPRLAEMALEFFDDHAGLPVMVLLHAVDPHAPYLPPETYKDRYITAEDVKQFNTDMQTANGSSETEVVMATRDSMSKQGIDVDRFAVSGRKLYDAELAFFDHNVGNLMTALKQRGLYEDLVFSFNSDHGEEFLEHDGTGHGQSLYGELIHVPWIVKAPGIEKPGRVVGDNVCNLDLGPTLLALAGLAPDPMMQGRDLSVALCQGDDLEPRAIITEQHGFFTIPGGDGISGRMFSLIEGRYKIIVRFRGGTPQPVIPGVPDLSGGDAPDYQVFDVVDDPMDQRNLYEEHKVLAEAAREKIKAFIAEQQEIQQTIGADSLEGISAADLDALRALGYIK